MSAEGKWVIVIVALLFAIGLVMIFSSTAVIAKESERYADSSYFLYRQAMWIVISLIGFYVAIRVDYRFWERHARWVLCAAALLLVAVLLPGIGSTINGARRWFRLGPLSFQPSEIAKLALLIFLASYVSSDRDRLKKFTTGIVPTFAAIAFVCGLVFLEPDVGTSVFIGLTALAVLIVAGAKPAHLLPIFGVCLIGVAIIALTKHDYVSSRVGVFLNPDADPAGKGYHLKQSLVALGSGGIFGVGLGNGISKLFFLPEVHSDFIFSVIGEELGFFGSMIVMALFAALLIVGWRICRKTDHPFGFLLAFGIVVSIVCQALINIAVVTGSMPTKGIPLPLVSFGGSSLVVTMFAIGILVNISNSSAANQSLPAVENKV